MKDNILICFLILLFTIFTVFITINSKSQTVIKVTSPSKIVVDLNKNGQVDNNELICVNNLTAFSTNLENFDNKYIKQYNLSNKDLISLGYLAEDFAQKTLLNNKIQLKNNPKKVTTECKFANIKVNGQNYAQILSNNGFGFFNDKINEKKLKQNLKVAQNLNLVILNHKSGKYHELDCPYGKIARDTVLIPEKHLPTNSIPCRYCHKKKTTNIDNNYEILELKNIPQPKLTLHDNNITIILNDYTKNLKPRNDCTNRVCTELVRLINNSTTSIDIATYGYRNNSEITKALARAKSRGVKIRFVYDSNYNGTAYYQNNDIIANIAIGSKSDKSDSKTDSNKLMHNKFLIFDNNTIYTGSMNLSSTGLSGYDINDVIIIKDSDISKLYKKEFEQMLSGKFHNAKQKLEDKRIFNIDNSILEIYFSPKDKTSTRINELIKQAKSYIYVPTFLITHKTITQELINAKNRGVDVRIIIDANSTTTRNTQHSTLRKAGILLKTENYAGKLHAKSMVIDDKYIITGSMNFSNSGENKNDENTLIIQNSKLAKDYKNYFLYLWTKIPNKYLKHNAHPESKDSIGSCFDGIDNNFNKIIDNEEPLCKN